MNKDNALAFISSMIPSESSYNALIDIIMDMDLEVTGVNVA